MNVGLVGIGVLISLYAIGLLPFASPVQILVILLAIVTVLIGYSAPERFQFG